MKFENTEVMNFEGALRGMRNPLNSWAKSDSFFGIACDHEGDYDADEIAHAWVEVETKDLVESDRDIDEIRDELYDKKVEWLYENGLRSMNYDHHYTANFIGPNDMNLAKRLIAGGTEHRKFLRQIMVSVDITAPLYWWKEFDTYKVGTTANSTSTMHKLASTPITLDCFETDDYNSNLLISEPEYGDKEMPLRGFVENLIESLEELRQKYNETKDVRYWKELVRWLSNGWLQTRTITMNYENLRSMYHQREYHKLTEWHTFCDWVKTLPYAEEFIIN
jgi:hypothetical protein